MTVMWVDRAACRGKPSSWWFSSDRFEQAVAKNICATCEVKVPCLDEALALDNENTVGIRGGLGPGERRALRR